MSNHQQQQHDHEHHHLTNHSTCLITKRMGESFFNNPMEQPDADVATSIAIIDPYPTNKTIILSTSPVDIHLLSTSSPSSMLLNNNSSNNSSMYQRLPCNDDMLINDVLIRDSNNNFTSSLNIDTNDHLYKSRMVHSASSSIPSPILDSSLFLSIEQKKTQLQCDNCYVNSNNNSFDNNIFNNESETKKDNHPWSIDEDFILITNQQILGNAWVDIAKLLPGRSRLDVKTRFRSISRAYKRIWKPNEDKLIIESHDSKRRNWIERASKSTNRSKSAVKARYKELTEKGSNPTKDDIPLGSPEQIFLQKKYQNSVFVSSFTLNEPELFLHVNHSFARPRDTYEAPKNLFDTNNNNNNNVDLTKRKKRSRPFGQPESENEEDHPSKSIFTPSTAQSNRFLSFPSKQRNVNNNFIFGNNENWNLIPQRMPDEGPLIPASIISQSSNRNPDMVDQMFYNQDISFDENDITSFIND